MWREVGQKTGISANDFKNFMGFRSYEMAESNHFCNVDVDRIFSKWQQLLYFGLIRVRSSYCFSVSLRKLKKTLRSEPDRAADLRPSAFGRLSAPSFSNLLGTANKSKAGRKKPTLHLLGQRTINGLIFCLLGYDCLFYCRYPISNQLR